MSDDYINIFTHDFATIHTINCNQSELNIAKQYNYPFNWMPFKPNKQPIDLCVLRV